MQSCIQIASASWLWARGGNAGRILVPVARRPPERAKLGRMPPLISEAPMAANDPKKPTREEEEELLEEQGEESFPSSDPPATEGSPHI
jgi:hypothetical protein